MSLRTSTTQNDLLLDSLLIYYDTKAILDRLISIINGESKVSLRIIVWFVTNYSKKNFVVYPVNERRFKVSHEYKLKLKAYSKMQFDMFRRHKRVKIPCNLVPEKHIETTVGQLNFFRWFFSRKIYDYMLQNLAKIEKQMMQKVTKKNAMKEKISTEIINCARRHNVEVKVTFK